jgi:glutamate N-acetyltransferase/amino-acid N-acetyltransferase
MIAGSVAPQPAVVDCPAGFTAGGSCCGIKPSGNDDLGLILCEDGASAAAVFTRNRVCGAPIHVSRAHLQASAGRARALIINSGCANAATGDDGLQRAMRVINALSLELDCPVHEVLMNSTGVIGEPLPDDRITAALRSLISSCAATSLDRAATAIMTTDTTIKMAEQSVHCQGRTCRVVGIAKGAGMIHPDMATMIAVLMTDAEIEPGPLDGLLRGAVDRSFHRISVDGDTSTNDAVFALASGAAGPFPAELLTPAFELVSRELARKILRDAEGATKLIHVKVDGGATAAEALQVAHTVASSLLVRTSIAGGDPNWGRILAAIGRSGVNIDINSITLRVNGLLLFTAGRPASTPTSQVAAAYASSEVILEIDLGMGGHSEEFMTCDLTEQYVRINAEYTT